MNFIHKGVKIVIIHVVQPGETLNTIAEQYGVTPERLIIDNELPNPENLVVGQSMIVRIPTEVYTVQPGDTLASIASSYDITTKDLLRNNPWAAVELNPGQTLVITFEEESKLSNALINGYAYPFIDRNTFRKTLPFLTYQSLFTYGFTPEGLSAA